MLEAFRTLPTEWDVIRWSRIMHSSNALAIARAIHRSAIIIRPSSSCNSFDTTKTFQELSKCFSRNIRANLKKARKRLQETPAWCVNVGGDVLAFEEFMRLEASGWKGESGTASAIRLRLYLQHFYLSLLQRKNIEFVPEVTLLKLGTTAVATQFSIWSRGSRHILKVAYDEDHARFSPGQILLVEQI